MSDYNPWSDPSIWEDLSSDDDETVMDAIADSHDVDTCDCSVCQETRAAYEEHLDDNALKLGMEVEVVEGWDGEPSDGFDS